ncbi:uncharacterized protein LOC110502118 [Arapaima gigas]
MVQLLNRTDAHKPPTNTHVNLSVSLQQKVELFCNVSLNNTTQLTWKKDGRVIFSFTKQSKETFKNFSSDRMRIDLEDPTTLWISAVQMSDVGTYLCSSNTLRGSCKMEWTLNIKGARNNSQSERNMKEIILYSILPGLGGMCVLVGISCILLFCRKQNNQNDLDCDGDYGEKAVQMRRTNRNNSSQYLEKFNSVYGS